MSLRGVTENVSSRLSQAAVVVDGKITTSRGPGTAMDFALTLIEQLVSKTKRNEVERPLLRPEFTTP